MSLISDFFWQPAPLLDRTMIDDGAFLSAWENLATAAAQLSPLVPGDTIEVRVCLEIPASIEISGRTVTTAWLVMKAPPTAADATANAAFTSAGGLLKITATNVAGIGQIEQANEAGVELRFDLTAANTGALTAYKSYHFEIQVKLSDNSIFTYERGVIETVRALISATS